MLHQSAALGSLIPFVYAGKKLIADESILHFIDEFEQRRSCRGTRRGDPTHEPIGPWHADYLCSIGRGRMCIQEDAALSKPRGLHDMVQCAGKYEVHVSYAVE